MSPLDPVTEIVDIPELRRFRRVTGVLGMLLAARGLRPGAALIEAFLAQGKTERAHLASGCAQLAALLEAPR